MSSEAKNIRLDATAFEALQEAAARAGKPLDQMASEAVLTGLNAEKLALVQRVLAKGHQYGAASGIREEEVMDVIGAADKAGNFAG
jgi:hypothetical protein